MRLLERTIIKEIKQFISTKDIIVLHGARQVGKTSVLEYLEAELTNSGKKTFYIDLEDLRFVELLDSGPEELIRYLEENNILSKKLLYLFIDEIQYLKNPSNFMKLLRDHHSDRIKLITSGSSSFEIKSKFKDSLVGRILNFELYPLSFKEFLLFKGYTIDLHNNIGTKISLAELQRLYKEYILYGGYPRIVLEKSHYHKEIYLQQIIDTYIRKDIRDLANIKDILKFNKLLEILASQSGQLLNIVELSNTAKLSRPTVKQYLFLMENTYILKLVYPYSSNLRSELFKTQKIFFYDTGLTHLLWLKTLPKTVLGNILETSIFSELFKTRGKREIFYWRTQDKKEVDFIIKEGTKILPIEVKLNQNTFTPTAMNYFMTKYHLKKGFCIFLEGLSKKKFNHLEFIYPWDIYKI